MSFVLFEIIVPAEKEDLQNDSEEIPNSGGSESDTDGEGDSEEDVKIEEWNSGDEPLSDKEDNGYTVKDTKERKINDSESKTDDDNLPTQADKTENNCLTEQKDDHSHESIDVTKVQKANETEEKYPKENGIQDQLTNNQEKTNSKETSGKNKSQNQQPNDKNKTVSNETQNQQKNDTNKLDSEETQNQQPNDVNKAKKTSVSSEKKIDNLKHSQRNSKRKKKGDRFTVKKVNDPKTSNEGKYPKNLTDDSGEKSGNSRKVMETNQKSPTPGKDRLGRKVQFQSQKQKSSDKSGNTSGENSGYNSTEPSGYNSTENSGYISDENSGESTEKKSTSSRYTPKYEQQFSIVEFIPEQISTLLESVKETINYLDIKNSVIVMTENQQSYKISFVEESGSRCEVILKFLKSCGVGSKDKSSISVIPVSIYYDLDTSTKDKNDLKDNSSGEDVVKDEDFKKSVKARLVVDQVVQSVRTNAALTFDYLVLTFLASLIAAVGLIESSSVVLVASMLISPLMGPILAIVFGSVIKNPFLWKLGLKNELIGLGVCIACGFLFGLFPAGLTMIGTSWRTTEEFPTIEMSSRGLPRSLIVGVLIAVPSGAGVALSVLGGNVGSLVGVAISASLLPPAVNAGMLWAYSIMTAISPPSTIPTASLGNLTDDLCDHFEFVDNTYQPYFSCDMWKEAAVLGVISLILTVVNILAILLMGHLVLRIKEVVPLKQKDTFTEFFHNDIKIARKSYQTHKNYESRALFEEFTAEQKLKTVTKDPEATTTKNPLFPNNVRMISRNKLETIAAGDDVQDITQHLNKPVSYNYDYLCNSSESLVPEKITSEKRKPKSTQGERNPSSNRKFEVVTYPDEVSKDQVREQKPKPEDDNDPSIQRELQQLDQILRKPSCISADEIQMQLLNKVPTTERDDSIEVEEQAQLKLADLFENPKLDYSQNPPTLKNNKDTSASNPSDSDKNENSQQAKCDTDSEGEMIQPLLNPKV